MVQYFGRVLEGQIVEEKLFFGAPPAPAEIGGSVAKWLPFVGTEPTFVQEYQCLNGPRYQITDTAINMFWTVSNLALPVVKAHHKAKAAALRWAYNNAGTFWIDRDGTLRAIDTSDSVVTKLIGATLMAILAGQQGYPFELNWKFGDGSFLTLNTETLAHVFYACASYIEDCYNVEALFCDAIDKAQTPEEVMAVDLTKGWPTNTPNPPDIAKIISDFPPIDTSVRVHNKDEYVYNPQLKGYI